MATLSLVESVDAFVAAIEKSGLLSADAMGKVREAAAKAENPMAVARPLVKEGTLTKWQASQLLYGYHQLVIGKYKLLDQLGAGEIGRVYLAEHAQMGRRHCLKVLSRRHTAKPEVLQRFLDDAQRVCALDHRNLSHIYDVNQGGNQYYIVMEYVEGQDLQSLVEKSGKLPLAESLAYVRQTAEGLAHAHERGVMHGDLKPSNLVLDESGTVKILDIGQARLAEGPLTPADKEDTTETASLAAAIYRAPEQRGPVRTIDQRSDVYSLGSVLCYLLSGKAAADAAAGEQQLQAVAKLPESLVRLCRQMMADQPEDRPATMQDVLAELEAIERERSRPPMPAAKAAEAKSPAAPAGKNGAKSAEPPAKSKKPPVAKALPESPAFPTAKALAASDEPAEADSTGAFAAGEETEEPSPFAGFAIQTKGSRKPPVKPAAKSSGEAAADISTASDGSAGATSAKKSYLPLILGGSIGGGVLAIAGVGLIVYLLFFRGSEPAEVAQAQAGPAAAKASEVPAEGNPTESNPAEESNPASEANPAAASPPASTSPEPNAPTSATSSSAEPPMPEAVKPVDPPAPAPMPEAKPPEPPMPVPTPTPAPEPPKPEPPKPEPPKPMPVANPLEGFAKTAALPKLGNAMSDLPPEALAPKALGPCKVDPKVLVIARLKGGEFAARGGRQKFELMAASGGTALQDWEVNLTGPEAPLLVARLGVKEGNLNFQWTPEGAKESNAPYLANCALELSAGAGHHTVAFREPVVGPPMTVELEKQGTAKWLVDNLPDPKSIHFEITRLDGIPRQKYDPENVMRGVGEDVTVWTGPTDDAMALGIKLSSGITGKNVQITSFPWVKFEGMKKPEKYSKKVLATNKAGATQQLPVLTQQLNAIAKAKDSEAQRNLLNLEIEARNKFASQVDALTGFVDALQGTGKIHFRVFYQADETTQVDLLVTSNDAAAPEKAEKPARSERPAKAEKTDKAEKSDKAAD